MNRNKITDIFIYIGLMIAFLTPRLPGIGSFVTLDEPQWLSQGANFYYALGQREFQNTVYEYQPAVTTMEIISLAMFLYFPEYRGLGQGYLDYEKGELDPFMYKHGYDPLVLLAYSRTIQVFVLLILWLILYYLLLRFFTKWVAVFAVLLVAFDPYYLGLTRIMTHEAMVALFILVSLVSLAVYFFRDQNFIFLLISGVAAGFAQLTKSSAIAMLGAIGVLLLFQVFQGQKGNWQKNVLHAFQTFIKWLLILALTYVVFWPGMWVAPGKMLYQVYGNAFSYAFQGARLTVTEDLTPSEFSLNTAPDNTWDVASVLLYRTTPIIWVGGILGLIFLFYSEHGKILNYRVLAAFLLTNTIAFVLLIGLAQGRNSPHYILSSYVSLDVLAAMGWVALFQRFTFKTTVLSINSMQAIVMAILVVFQVFSSTLKFPYYFTYRNPILYAAGWYQEYPQKPYGEALEMAADYLSKQPDASDSTAFVYYSRGCFSYFYPGKSISFRPYYIDGDHSEDLMNNLNSSDYLVVYYANQVQFEKYHPFLSILAKSEPYHVIWMDGYEYVRIYKVDTLSSEILEALAGL